MERKEAQSKIETLVNLLTERQEIQLGKQMAEDFHTEMNLEYIKGMLADWMLDSKELSDLISGRVKVISNDIAAIRSKLDAEDRHGIVNK